MRRNVIGTPGSASRAGGPCLRQVPGLSALPRPDGELWEQQDPPPLNTPASWAWQLQPLCPPAGCVEAGLGTGSANAFRKVGNRLVLVPRNMEQGAWFYS